MTLNENTMSESQSTDAVCPLKARKVQILKFHLPKTTLSGDTVEIPHFAFEAMIY